MIEDHPVFDNISVDNKIDLAQDYQQMLFKLLARLRVLLANHNDPDMFEVAELAMYAFSTVCKQYDLLKKEYLKQDGAFQKLLEAVQAHVEFVDEFEKQITQKMKEKND